MTKKIEQKDHGPKSQLKIRRKKKNRMNGTDFAVKKSDILATEDTENTELNK
jgi:hypothetical protein